MHAICPQMVGRTSSSEGYRMKSSMRQWILVLFALVTFPPRARAADTDVQSPRRRDLTEQQKQSQGSYSRPAPHRSRLHREDLHDEGDATGRQRSHRTAAGKTNG